MIVNNLAFPKYYAPDRFVPFMQAHSSHPIAIAATEKKSLQNPPSLGPSFLASAGKSSATFRPTTATAAGRRPLFFFAIKQGYGVEQPVTKSFAHMVSQFTQPMDLWVIRSEIDPADPLITATPSLCQLASDTPQGNKGGYLYLHFSCRGS